MADLRQQLRQTYVALKDVARLDWQRDLPLDELLLNRWDRARVLEFGKDSSIYASAYVYGTPKVGRNVWIGPWVLLDATGGLEIGDGCQLSAGVQVYTHDTVARTVTGGRAQGVTAPVRIGARTYVGPQTVISKGVTIGEQCVIGANSFVREDVPDRAFVAGSPARVLGRVVVDGATVRLER